MTSATDKDNSKVGAVTLLRTFGSNDISNNHYRRWFCQQIFLIQVPVCHYVRSFSASVLELHLLQFVILSYQKIDMVFNYLI